MEQLRQELVDLSIEYEVKADKEDDKYQKIWLYGIALGLRRAIRELDHIVNND